MGQYGGKGKGMEKLRVFVSQLWDPYRAAKEERERERNELGHLTISV